MTHPYGDIIHLSRPQSRRAKMSGINRAAQFAPFAALTGYEASIQESGRLTGCRKELDEDEKARLNGILCALAEKLERRPVITVTRFVPDIRKDGGAYECFTGCLKKIHVLTGCLEFEDATQIPIEGICQIQEGDCVDNL